MWRDDALLLDILIAARNVIEFTSGVSKQAFDVSEVIQSAVMYQLQIIGEAARRVSEERRSELPQILWHSIIGMRNRLIHAYFRINVDTVWEIVQNDIPTLIVVVEPLVPPEE